MSKKEIIESDIVNRVFTREFVGHILLYATRNSLPRNLRSADISRDKFVLSALTHRRHLWEIASNSRWQMTNELVGWLIDWLIDWYGYLTN